MNCEIAENIEHLESEVNEVRETHLQQFREHSPILKQLTDDGEKMRNTLHGINNSLQGLIAQNELAFIELKDKLDDYGYIKILNGDGRTVEYKRDEFDQWTYDRFRWKGWTKISIGILGAILTALTIINLTFQLLTSLHK